jgi:hypothetical protein
MIQLLEMNCSICWELTINKTQCHHPLCKKCFKLVELCPICRSEFNSIKSRNINIINRIFNIYSDFINKNNAEVLLAYRNELIIVEDSFIRFMIKDIIQIIEIIL